MTALPCWDPASGKPSGLNAGLPRRHKFPDQFRLKGLVIASLLACSASFPAQAALDEEVAASARLSVWLGERLARISDPRSAYWPGLVWTVPEEREAQAKAKSGLESLVMQPELSDGQAMPAEAREGLLRLITSLPVTGRVVLEKTDPRWLEANPAKDPVLKQGHRLKLVSRPRTVTLVFGDGQTCDAEHEATRPAKDYLAACAPGLKARSVWIVQPDGIVQHRNVAIWNEQAQDPPAPGAWLVVQDSRFPWHERIYEQLARLLATQGPAEGRLDRPARPLTAKSSGLLAELYRAGIPTGLKVTASDWGGIGLLQTPTARMAPAGEASVSISHTAPYTRLNFNLQPFDWLETSFRYVDISNVPYGPTVDQSYKDKSIDIKLRLSRETEYLPETAVGIRDLTGTGLFSGEYLVASKRTGPLDWSLGIGWGYLGGRGNLENPLAIFGDSFKTRPTETESDTSGGEVNFSTFFHGPAALFGGVQYQPPWDDLILKLEYDGNDYQHEPQNNNQDQDSPFNFGAVWRYNDNLDLTLGWERGNTLLVGANFHGRLDKLDIPKVNDPKKVPVSPQYPATDPDWTRLAQALEQTTGWRVQQLSRAGSELRVRFDEVDAFHQNDFIERIAAILHRDVSAKILVFRIQAVDHDLRLSEQLVDRVSWVDAQTRFLPPHEKRSSVLTTSYVDGFVNPFDETLLETPEKHLHGDYGLYYQQSLGGPDGFVLYQLGGRVNGTWQPRNDTWLTGVLRVGLIDNYEKYTVNTPTDPAIPRVRTFLKEYVTTSNVTMPNLQLTHVGKLNSSHYYSLYGGMLESMYGGVGGEWLYRPFGSKLAVGVDLNLVKQRAFEQNFEFCDRSECIDTSFTGHVSLYWDTGIQDVQATIQAGQYLAGDVGVTVNLGRVFDNGVKMGAWFTKTDMSTEEFGEGSFDKGIYVDIPFDVMMPSSSASIANLVWQPLTRDGGARLARSVTLDELTRSARGDSLHWRPFSAASRYQFGDAADPAGDPGRKISFLDAALGDVSTLEQGLGQWDFWQSIALAGGVTLLSSTLDKTGDDFAVKHGQSSPMKALQNAGNLLPFALIGVSGAMALSEDDPKLSRASFASLSAGGMAALTTLGLKYAVGRARPEANLSSSEFTPFSKDNGDSSFPSMHTAVAWATLTPYAKAYDAPWLYGLAALTNVARINERKHWLSDTVAGAFLGYGLGSLFYENRRRDSSTPSLYVTPGEIGLEWVTP